MKVIIEFNLPEDEYEYRNSVKASEMYNALWDIKKELRNALKYGELNESEYKAVESMQNRFFDILNEYEIVIN
jgi:hypothetical protein